MDLFDLQASISISIQNAIDSLIRLGEEASEVANRIERGIGGNNEAHIDTDEAQENVEDLTDDVEDQEKAVDDLEDKHSKLGGVLGGVGKGMLALGGFVVGLTGGFLALGESTQEYREDMGKLETAFKNAGHTTETAKQTYSDFFAVLGEEDRSVEAVNHLAELTSNTQELSQWSDICAGVVGRFGDSLPIESLTESANETAKVGKVTGAFADALNWAGLSEDEFNQKLAECNSETERATLITSVLHDTYKESADIYKEVNGSIMDSRTAQQRLTDTIAEFGKVAEPILTTIKDLTADLLNQMLPFVQLIGEGLTDAIGGDNNGLSKIAEGLDGLLENILNKAMNFIPQLAEVVSELIPMLITTILDNLPRLIQVILEAITTIIDMIANSLPDILIKISEMLPEIILSILDYIPALITALTQVIIGIVDALPTIIENLISALPSIIEAIINVLLGSIDILLDACIKLLMAIIDAIPVIIDAIIENLPKIITTIIDGLIQAIPKLLDGAIKFLLAIIDAIPVLVDAIIGDLPRIIDTIIDGLLEAQPQLIQASIDLFMGIVKAIPKIISSLIKSLDKITGTIFDTLKEIDLLEIGKDIIKGLINGLVEGAKGIWKAIKGIGKDIVDGFKDFFDINSPSRVIKNEIGYNIGDAVGVGAIESIPSIKKNIDQVSDSVYEQFDTNINPTNDVSYSGETTNNNALIEKLDSIENALKSLKIYLNNDVLVGEIAHAMDYQLGTITTSKERGN